jgi:hypothetical protein
MSEPLVCSLCDKEISSGEKKYLFGNDVPYLNVYIHRSCFDQNRSNMQEFIPKLFEVYRKWRKKR